MSINYLQEAFTELDCLNEDTFKATVDGIEELDDFMSNDELDDTIQVIDTEAETEEDLKDNYEGDVILECPACKSKLYKSPEEIKVDEETETCNIGEECPYCYTTGGFKIIGQVAPFSVKDLKVTAEKTDDEDGEKDEEKVEVEEKKDDEEELKESFNNASIQLDNNKITIESTEENVDGAEMIEPLSADLKSDIGIDDNGMADETFEDETEGGDFAEEEIDIDDFDEDSFDEMAESYLKENFSDIRSYKTRNVRETDNKLIVEGVVRFNNGQRKNTQFNLTPDTVSGRNNMKFICENVNLPKRKRTFMLEGRYRKSSKKFIAENYSAR